MNKTAQNWINKLGLQKHPEGGYYQETYRSDEMISSSALPLRYNGERNSVPEKTKELPHG